MIKKIITLVILSFCIISCQDKQTKPKSTLKKQQEVVKKPKELTKDNFSTIEEEPIITQKNVLSFLTKYGQEHQESNVLIKTRLGEIHIQLYKETPLHRANFVYLIKEGYYNTTCFHRVVDDFIIQAGQSDNPKTQLLRKKIGAYRIPPEFVSKYKHHKGTLSAARRWNQNPKKLSDAYEFFIVHKKKGLHHLDQEHTIFGKVTKGLDVVDKIAKEAIDKGEWPLNDVHLEIAVY